MLMTKLHVLVVLQTHSKGDSSHYSGASQEKRYCNAPKSEITRRCTRSLIESLNYAKELFLDCEFELVVYDDHSDEQTITDIKNNLNIATFRTEFIPLETYGIVPSILKCYEHGRDHGKEIVYFAQDDYLYDTTAIHDMIITMMNTSNNLGNYTAIYPFNDPYKYVDRNTAVQCHLIRSQKRHWRTVIGSASCLMVHHQMLIKNWDLFEAMGNHALTADMEDRTINRLWQERGYYLFVPIPSLALHMQYSTEYDDQINWREWWDRYGQSELLTPTTDSTIVDIKKY